MAEFADSFPSSKGNFVKSYLQTTRGTRLKFCINKCFYGHNDPRLLTSGPLSPPPPGVWQMTEKAWPDRVRKAWEAWSPGLI